MDRFFRRCMRKKGFTMVELLVVIAIIGVLAAMIIPNLMYSDVPEKGKGYAKSYYFTAQEFFSRKKIADDARALNNSADKTTYSAIPNHVLYLYTTVDSFGRPVESGVLPGTGTPTDTKSNADIQANSSVSEPYKALVADFDTYMVKYLKECDCEGTYFLVVDGDFRVQAAYWSDATFDELKTAKADFSFDDDNIVGGYWCCAYPAELSTVAGVSDRAMFKYTY